LKPPHLRHSASPQSIVDLVEVVKNHHPTDETLASTLSRSILSPTSETYPATRENQYGGTGMLHLLWTALIGLIVGALAKLIIPGKEPGGIFITMLIGIAGSFLGTFLGRAIGHYEPDQSAGFIMSLIGALILLGIYHLIKRARTTT
jgi:uncharacterized membrane protein YeaQ/YmgE (transglycosylase-associated protein family)